MARALKIKDNNEAIEKFGPREPLIAQPKLDKQINLRDYPDLTVEAEEQEVITEPAKKYTLGKIISISILAAVVLGLVGTSYYFYHKYKTVTSVVADDTVAKIGRMMELPQGENPTLATVTDKEKMKDQPFFAHAENGDKVLIFIQAKKAILYRPSSNKLIEVMPLTIGNADNSTVQQTVQQADASSQAAPEQPVAVVPLKVAIYNGSGIKGEAVKIGDEIAKIEGMTVTEKTNAVGNFDKTLVVDISGNNADGAQKIADAIGATIGSLPDGEKSPNADILVIGGVK